MTVVKSADRVIQILEGAAAKDDGVTHGELSRTLGIPKGSLSPLLANLVERDYLTLDRTGKLYRLGPRLLVLTGRYLSKVDLVRVGRSILQELVGEINEDVEIAVRKGNDILFLWKEECSQPLKYSIGIGEVAPLYATSGGKAILAYLPEDEFSGYLVSARLDQITKKSITDPDMLRHELEEIRVAGLAYGREEYHQGICAIAAPVFNLHGDVVGAVLATLPSVRFNARHKAFIEPKLREAARKISRRLGFDACGKEDRDAGCPPGLSVAETPRR